MSKIPEKIPFPKSKLPAAVNRQTPRLPVIKAITAASRVRRSKSFSDLRTLSRPLGSVENLEEHPKAIQTAKPPPKTILKTTSKTAAAKPPINYPTKRPLPSEAKKDGPPKPKQARTVRVPEWDYKTRFNILKEKYENLNSKSKEFESKMADLDKLEEDFVNTKASLKTSEEAVRNLSKFNEEVNEQCKVLTALNKNLNNDIKRFTDLEKILETTILEKDCLKSDLEKMTDKFNVSEKRRIFLEEENDALKKNTEEKTTRLDTLKHDFDELLKKYEDKRAEAIQIHTELNDTKGMLFISEQQRRQLHNDYQDLKGNIRVFCRIRPALTDAETFSLCSFNYIDEKSFEIKKDVKNALLGTTGKENKQEFTFDKVFHPETTQEMVFEDLAQLVQSAVDGYHVCVFAYGQTGSGKTFTMQGESPTKLGMIPKTIQRLFDIIERKKKEGWLYKVSSSFLEIYNENIHDLLDPDSNKSLEIRFNEGKGTTVTNLTIEEINAAPDLMKLMVKAQKNRATAVTDFNEHSSRSHAVTKLYLEGYHSESNTTYIGSINLVDLAGSESAKTSKVDRLAETKHINKSLSTLGSVMLALYNKETHIPYRNSKLTFLLQSCLGGNSKTLMFVNISPTEDCYGESINSLRFAAKVKEVKTISKRNKTSSVQDLPKLFLTPSTPNTTK